MECHFLFGMTLACVYVFGPARHSRPPPALPSALRNIVIGCIGVSCPSSCASVHTHDAATTLLLKTESEASVSRAPYGAVAQFSIDFGDGPWGVKRGRPAAVSGGKRRHRQMDSRTTQTNAGRLGWKQQSELNSVNPRPAPPKQTNKQKMAGEEALDGGRGREGHQEEEKEGEGRTRRRRRRTRR